MLSLSAEQVVNHNDSWCVAATGSTYFYSLFLAISISQLCPSRWNETNVGPSWNAPKGWGSWMLTPLFLSWWEELFIARIFPLDPEQSWLGGWDDAREMKLSSFSSYAVFIGSFVPMCCSNFFSRLQSCFCSWIANCWSLGKDVVGFSYLIIWG